VRSFVPITNRASLPTVDPDGEAGGDEAATAQWHLNQGWGTGAAAGVASQSGTSAASADTAAAADTPTAWRFPTAHTAPVASIDSSGWGETSRGSTQATWAASLTQAIPAGGGGTTGGGAELRGAAGEWQMWVFGCALLLCCFGATGRAVLAPSHSRSRSRQRSYDGEEDVLAEDDEFGEEEDDEPFEEPRRRGPPRFGRGAEARGRRG
jgi:hypothetical protein